MKEPPIQAEPLVRGERGTILLFCYHFGPHNHTGGFRWRSMQRELAVLGWQLHVVGVDAAGTGPTPTLRVPAATPLSRLRARLARRRAGTPARAQPVTPVDPDTVSVRKAGAPPAAGEALRASVNGALDALEASSWSRRARAAALRLSEAHRFDAVVATTPEVSAPLAASAFARQRRLPLIVDYRDPVYFGRGPERSRLDPATRRVWQSWERGFLADAAAITDISWGAHRDSIAELRQEAPELARIPRFCIPSGHDPFEAGPVDPKLFRIIYTGWVWPFMPLPRLISAVGALRRRRGLKPHELRLELIGVEPAWNGIPLEALAAGVGLGNAFEARGRVSREEAALAQTRAAVLVLFDSVCAHGICIPSKLYHYALCRGRILAIGRPDGAMAEEAARIGVPTLDPEDHESIVVRLQHALEDWQAGGLTRPNDPDGVLSAARRGQEMAQVIEAVVEDPKRLSSLAVGSPRW